MAYLALLDGNSIPETRAAILAKTPQADADAAIATAIDKFRQVADEDRKAILGWCLASSRDLARRLSTVGDYIGALKAVKQVHEIAQSEAQSMPNPDTTPTIDLGDLDR